MTQGAFLLELLRKKGVIADGKMVPDALVNPQDLSPLALALARSLWKRDRVSKCWVSDVSAIVSLCSAERLGSRIAEHLNLIGRQLTRRDEVILDLTIRWEENGVIRRPVLRPPQEELVAGQKVLVVSDLLNETDVAMIKEVIDALGGYGAKVVGVAVFAKENKISVEDLGLDPSGFILAAIDCLEAL